MRPDPALPASRHLTGDDAIALLSAALEPGGVAVERCTVRSVHHKPARSLAVVYAATVRTPRTAVANGHGATDGEADATRDVLLVAWTGVKRPPEGTAIVAAGDLSVAVWRFPHDPWLPGLPPAVHRTRVRELLDRLGAPAGHVGIHTRSYRPTRRAVVEVSIDADTPDQKRRLLYLKVLPGDGATRLADVHRQLAGAVPVPVVAGVAQRQGIVAFQALGGPTLRQAVIGGFAPPPEAILDFQRRLADVALDSTARPRRFADPSRHVRLLKQLVPHQAHRLDAIAGQVGDDHRGEPQVTVHGDFHDGQLLIDERGITGMIDVDGAGRGLLVEDCANMIAHLEALALVSPGVTARIDDYAGALADVYRGALDPETFSRAVAAAWLGLATGPYRAQESDWPDGTVRRIECAQQWLQMVRV